MGNTNDSFKSFLYEKKKSGKKRKKRNKRKFTVGGGPAVGQGGMGGDVSFGDGGTGGESFVPSDGSFLHELAMSPLAMTSSTLAHTQASTTNPEQSQKKQKPKTSARQCPRCGCRLRKKDRYCPRCGEACINVGTEQQEKEADVDQQDIDSDNQDQQPDDQTVDLDGEQEDMMAPDEEEEPQDSDKEGIIRTVDNAHLVYKRQTPDGDYEELWIYNIDTDLRNELEIRRNILAGTDIPQGKTKSEDGSQSYDLVTLGNAQLLHIKGLQN